MARRRPSGSFSSYGRDLTVWGVDDLIKKLASVESDIEPYMQRAMEASAEPIKRDLKVYMDTHLKGRPKPTTQVTDPRGEGITAHYIDTYFSVQAKTTRKLKMQVGWRNPSSGKSPASAERKQKYGLPALFMDIGTKSVAGTPLVKPTYFMWYIVRNNEREVHDLQERYLQNLLRDRGLL